MAKKCCICGEYTATLKDSKIVENTESVFYFCEPCYKKIVKAGLVPIEIACKIAEQKGKICDVCGTTLNTFDKSFMFGCPDCYRQMREFAMKVVSNCQSATSHTGKTPFVGNSGNGGNSGNSGNSGNCGYSGNSGNSGNCGYSGNSGNGGNNGYSGNGGYSGNNGNSGGRR